MRLFRFVLPLLIAGSLGAGTAPDFALKKLDGSVFKLRDVIGKKTIVVDFWGTWCAPCTKALKKFQAIHDTHPDVLVLAVAIDDASSMAKVSQFIQGKGYTFEVLLDPDSSVMKLFNPSLSVPYTFVIDRKGEIAYTHSGYVVGDEKELLDRLDDLK